MLAPLAALHAAEEPPWVGRLAFWAKAELDALKQQSAAVRSELERLPAVAGVNSGNRIGFQSGGRTRTDEMWLELELASPTPVDSVVLFPLLTKGSGGEVAGSGFPRRFALEVFDEDDNGLLLMDETNRDFPRPGLYPVAAPCPPGVLVSRIRLTATEPWQNEGPPLLALSEIMVLRGNRNMTAKAKVRSSSSREIPPAWSRNNLIDMMTPLGAPVAPSPDATLMGWHDPVSHAMEETRSVTVDLGRPFPLDEIRLLPAWRPSMPWDLYYGFPARFRIEAALRPDFADSWTVHDRTSASLLSPGQNLQCFPTGGRAARHVRVTATRLRERSGDYVFALGELQAYAADVNVARGAAVEASELAGDPEWSRAGLTDGCASGGRILELPEWVRLLQRRAHLEEHLAQLAQRRRIVFTRAENTLVGASVGSASAFVVMAVVFSWRSRRQRIRDRERHRERLARDLHDELGSNLGSIALISSFAAQEDPEQMRLDLAEIERVARESADSMRDMVSLLAGKRGGVAADWMNVMAGLAERLLRGVDLKCRLPTAPLVWEPNLETRRELYLFCKEVLHNAARHGGPTRVTFDLSPTPGGLRIEITDDGVGFDSSAIDGGHGLPNLRERAAMMRARMSLTSSPGAGTQVILDVPRARRWTRR